MTNGSEQVPTGQVSVTPEGGPINEGAPPSDPGAGQVLLTPEAGPASGDELLTPPTWHEHMEGPVLGLDDVPAGAAPRPPAVPSPREEPMRAGSDSRPGVEFERHAEEPMRAGSDSTSATPPASTRTAADDKELSKWPPYRGKPVTDISVALRYVAPVAAQAEKLTIRALDLSGRGLTNLAHFLQERRQERDAAETDDQRKR